jgi:pyruvate/2-oxoglutarate dehydrogenase complex dihydrolipoamide acyltransferase (E2) component
VPFSPLPLAFSQFSKEVFMATKITMPKLSDSMRVTLSADHRLVDGADAAGFLAKLRKALENPYLMLV